MAIQASHCGASAVIPRHAILGHEALSRKHKPNAADTVIPNNRNSTIDSTAEYTPRIYTFWSTSNICIGKQTNTETEFETFTICENAACI